MLSRARNPTPPNTQTDILGFRRQSAPSINNWASILTPTTRYCTRRCITWRKSRAAANLGLHFVGIPGIPYLGDVQRAMTAIYTEDPAVLRARQRKVLAGYGFSQAEVGQFENTVLLSPTRQALLVENAKLLEGVAGRDELFRHAMSLTSEVEVGVFIESARLWRGCTPSSSRSCGFWRDFACRQAKQKTAGSSWSARSTQCIGPNRYQGTKRHCTRHCLAARRVWTCGSAGPYRKVLARSWWQKAGLFMTMPGAHLAKRPDRGLSRTRGEASTCWNTPLAIGLKDATPSVFHQRHLGWLLRSSCNGP